MIILRFGKIINPLFQWKYRKKANAQQQFDFSKLFRYAGALLKYKFNFIYETVVSAHPE